MRFRDFYLTLAGWLFSGLAAGAWAGDLEAIQGSWKVLAFERGGGAAGGNRAEKKNLVVSFAGTEIGVGAANKTIGSPIEHLFGANAQKQGTFRLDPSEGPKSIDLMYRFLSHDGWARSTEPGIYLLDGDLLVISTAPPGKPRPAGFASPVENGTLMVLTRLEQRGQSLKASESKSRAAIAKEITPDPLVGKWDWFTGGKVTIREDGTLVHEFGNEGTWKRSAPASRIYTLTWRYNDYVDTITLSDDLKSLAGSNQTGYPIDAQRAGD